ncbi:MAG: NAD-dependent epimerase/dehydratase family protein [Spirochaetaceae bacterium]|nr:MAG: NAD-dependent epimerase/dehydratase family protein [Spirochaetaceae bacterium]
MAQQVSFLLYGAYGYTGRLVVERLVSLGLRPILAGRNRARVEAVAREFGLPFTAFEITDSTAMDAALKDVPLVLNCAGPFRNTFTPFADSCIRTATHYLDVTGEIDVFHRAAARHCEFINAGIMVMPGVGFDIVPSDYLACYVKTRLPSADRLVLAFGKVDSVSRGTAATVLDQLGRPGLVRREGKIAEVSTAWRQRSFDFGNGPELSITAPLADVFSAYYTTGIPDIECYVALPCRVSGWALKIAHRFIRPQWFRGLLRRRLQKQDKAGPDAHQRAVGNSVIFAEASSREGQRVQAIMRGPEPYTMTALVAAAAVQCTLDGKARPGFQTPSPTFGAALISAVEDFEVEDLE